MERSEYVLLFSGAQAVFTVRSSVIADSMVLLQNRTVGTQPPNERNFYNRTTKSSRSHLESKNSAHSLKMYTATAQQ